MKMLTSELCSTLNPYDSITNNDELGIVETEKVEWSNSIFPFYGVTLALAIVVTVITLLTH